MDPDELTPMPPLTLGRRLWAIRRDVLPRLAEAHRLGVSPLWTRLAAQAAEGDQGKAKRYAARRRGARAAGAVAVIPLTGIITPNGGSLLSFLFGGYGGLQAFRQEFREALTDPDVGAIVLDIDSPGGLTDLVHETATEVFEARGAKPIVSVANTMAASAAYYIGVQADELVVTPSGDVGAIGTYMVHEDWSGWNEQAGIAPTYISGTDSPYKTEGNMDEPLSDEALARFQQEIDDLTAMFVGAVAQARDVSTDTVIAEYGGGRTLLAARALEAGMVDRIAPIEDVIGELLGSKSDAGSRGAKIELLPRAEAPTGQGSEEAPEEEEEEDETDVPALPDPDEEPADDDEEDADPDEDDETAGPDPESRAALAELLYG